ncbi:MAG: type II secretion system GspH family protein [Lentisphaeraceae bacterium]|nr:type II secretion system GspH family protein [Lentisphaeraceae bacterium]
MQLKRFTLTELLVVIAIICFLMTLLIPSLNNARKKAKTVVCASNMSQVSRSMYMFLKNNNQFFPIGIRNNTPYDDMLAPYDGRNLTDSELSQQGFEKNQKNLDRHQLYNCPSSLANQLSNNIKRTYVLNNGQDSWYSPNNYGLTWLRWGDEPEYNKPVNINHVNTASQMYMLSEFDMVSANDNQGAVGHTNSSQGRYIHITDSQYHDKLNLHGRFTMNAVFVDGSLKLQRQSQLLNTSHWDRSQ